MDVIVTIRIKDAELWRRFKEYVILKYGKLHGALGEELTQAIKQYLESSSTRTHTETQNISSRTMNNLRKIVKQITKVSSKEIPQTMLEKMITEKIGGDWRTHRKYIWLLTHGYSILRPVRTIAGTDKFIFEVNLDEARKLIEIHQ